MAGASKSRARSRKRRPAPGGRGRAPAPGAEGQTAAPGVPGRTPTAAAKPASPPSSSRLTFGERPRAPWHPLPLSEILILTGALATVIALRNRSSELTLLVAGVIAVALGTFEVTAREHLGGYRSHAVLLAVVPVLVFHSAAVLAASAFTNPTVLLSLALLPVDLALFVFLFRLLRARFLDARRRRAPARR